MLAKGQQQNLSLGSFQRTSSLSDEKRQNFLQDSPLTETGSKRRGWCKGTFLARFCSSDHLRETDRVLPTSGVSNNVRNPSLEKIMCWLHESPSRSTRAGHLLFGHLDESACKQTRCSPETGQAQTRSWKSCEARGSWNSWRLGK